MTLIVLLVLTLAVYRLTRLVTRDELTRPLRERWLMPLIDDTARGRAAYALTCPLCLSVWLSLALGLTYLHGGIVWRLVECMAVAGAAGLLLDRDRA